MEKMGGGLEKSGLVWRKDWGYVLYGEKGRGYILWGRDLH